MIADLLHKERISLGAELENKDAALRLAATLLAADPEVSGVAEEDIYRLLVERESLGSTGIGEEIAIPHATLPGVSQISLALITIPKGVNFESLDGKPVRVIFAMIAPVNQRSAHVRNLADLSRLAKDPAFVDSLVATKAYSELSQLLGENADDAPTVKTVDRSLLFAIVRKIEYLEPLLEVLAGMTESEAVVMEGHGSARYLQTLPLFSMFWTDESSNTDAKVVMAVIDRHAGNETLRRITAGVADPAREEGLLVALQDLSLVSGNFGF